ncbi:OLC1v1027104C1 [Oldenlandia corymbosa var. corymbosa]|uniref:OLC1v1027104C1 n=1 Tax=Oldenlandia corymbosa var. corymbosa TaxID=529605 RepID=A0AAV1CAL9_OLDCO|nr:OLC1v1027104C1 [Oldenlandia corymbosa var. corymbosa]
MAKSIADQIKALKLKVDADPRKKPHIRPSIIYNPKDAADIDIDTIFSLALSGLEVLVSKDERFSAFKRDLFNHKSKDMDRELMGIEENNQINASIASYLKLLSGFFELLAARKTLEYLIRRYKIHVYNTEELILCTLPYHDTHEFVRVIQLIDPGNSRWKFLDGVKGSGAPAPRKVIVQQCIRDLSVLEAICNFAMPAKKIQSMKAVTSFCTAVILEVLGSMITVSGDVVNKILPYLISGLQPGAKGNIEHKAGALMIVGLLSQKTKLSSSLVKTLIRSIIDVAQEDAKEPYDLQLFRMPLMALINLVQLQHVVLIPKKSMDLLLELRDISEILGVLTEEFNIDQFLTVFLNSLLEHSSTDPAYHHTLMVTIDTIPLKFYVDRLVSKLLKSYVKECKDEGLPKASESGSRANEILTSLYKRYPIELREAVRRILQDSKLQSGKEGNQELFLNILEGDGGFPVNSPDSKLLFALEHPKPEVRRSAVTGLDVTSILKVVDAKVFDVIQDALLRRLMDDDLTVIQAALNVQCLDEIISLSALLDILESVLDRCISILMSSASDDIALASDVAVSCLQRAIMIFKDHDKFTKKLAKMILPLVLILPKIQQVNFKALELAKEVKWPLFGNRLSLLRAEKKRDLKHVSSVNLENISKLAEYFLVNCNELTPWLLECSKTNQLSKTVYLFLLLQSSMLPKPDFAQFSLIYDASFQLLQCEWDMVEVAGIVVNAEETKSKSPGGDWSTVLTRLSNSSRNELNAELLICLCWRLVECFIVTAQENDNNEMWLSQLRSLYIFFVTRANRVLKEPLHHLVSKCKLPFVRLLTDIFTEEGSPVQVQAESLHYFEHLCSTAKAEKDLSCELAIQLLDEFPSLLVPLASSNQDVRMAAMACIEKLRSIHPHVDLSRSKNGRSVVWMHFLGELLGLMVPQKMLMLSNQNVLPSILKALLSTSSESLLVQENIGNRFDESTKDKILAYLLSSVQRLSAYAKVTQLSFLFNLRMVDRKSDVFLLLWQLKVFSMLKDLGNKVTRDPVVKSLMENLLERRYQYHIKQNELSQKLSQVDNDILCLLLEMCMVPTLSDVGHDFGDHAIVKALQVSGCTHEDAAIVGPCITVLKHLNNSVYGCLKAKNQEKLFSYLVILLRNGNADIQNSAREALLQLNVSYLVVKKMLDFIVHHLGSSSGSNLGKKKKKSIAHQGDLFVNVFQRGDSGLSFLSSLLDVLILKKNMDSRSFLIGSLFELLHFIFMNDEWVNPIMDEAKDYVQASPGGRASGAQVYIQQTILMILEDICSPPLSNVAEKDEMVNKFDLELLVKCARLSSDIVTRNHVLSLFSTIAKTMPDKVLNHILDILNIIGESAVSKWDAHSLRVFEEVISAVVPFWLSETRDTEKMLQIFVDVLPQIPQHQKLSIITCLLRNLGESNGLSSFLFLLFYSLVSQDGLFSPADKEPAVQLTSIINTRWEYIFALELSAQYSCIVCLHSLVLTLKRIRTAPQSKEHYTLLLVAMQFVLEKLQDPEVSFKLESGEDADVIQGTLGALMEQVVSLFQWVNVREKSVEVSLFIRKGLKELMHVVLKASVRSLVPLSYFKVMLQLLRRDDKNVRKKALGLLCETAKESGATDKSNQRRRSGKSLNSLWLQFDDTAKKSLDDTCLEILKLIDDPDLEGGAALKLSAVTTLEALVERFPLDDPVLAVCLRSLSKTISPSDSAVSAGCLRAASAFIHVLGPRALSELPGIMKFLFDKSQEISTSIEQDISNSIEKSSVPSRNLKESISMSLLISLEAIVDKLGGFLNPYLDDILQLLVLHPCYASTADERIKLRADSVRKLITAKIPVRLLLPALLRIYSGAIKSGGSSVSITFEMLGNMVQTMDRSAIAAYHVQIFDLGLLALDLRCQHNEFIKDIYVVEEKVIDSIVRLSMKLTETMFKPLFVKSIEWSRMDQSEGSKSIDRSLSFYGLVNKLVESHRSLFVPYFKYLLNGCIQHLCEDARVGLTPKKKKLKSRGGIERNDIGEESLGLWHLRALIISSLQKCFVYDTGNLKFLDSSNFQILLKPLVSQLVMEPPPSLQQHPEVPSVDEVDNILVSCIGQMAVTAGSDLLWKPLNHEVLMQTRSEMVRARILGLRIVKYLVENLKEEYLVLLPETIPFLGELLEDVERPVKTLSQEILKQMEFMSGENLRDYL